MRDGRPTRHSNVLLLVLLAVLASPLAALASSGLPPTITMDPAAAGPGSVVEISGIDFPAKQLVEVQLDSAAGRTDLALIVTSDAGYLRAFVQLPADLEAGSWELRATALDGSSASHAFDAASAQTVDASGASPASAEAGLSVRRGNTGSDIMVMLILAVLLAAVGGGAAYAWREVHGERVQPGMGAGSDPIWSLAGSDDRGPELTAALDPEWDTLRSKS
jgi:hypothetical protein